MDIEVRLFASLAEAFGFRQAKLSVPDGITAGELWEMLPGLAGKGAGVASGIDTLKGRIPVACAINQSYAKWETRLVPGDEVAFIPPVAGGNAGDGPARLPVPFFEITDEPLDAGRVFERMGGSAVGATVLFVGTVRQVTGDRETLKLRYDAYGPMAVSEMRGIGCEVEGRWPDTVVSIVHRTGELLPGEASVVIAAASAHRAEAFEACRHAIERLKVSVPIWKKEVSAGEEHWV